MSKGKRNGAWAAAALACSLGSGVGQAQTARQPSAADTPNGGQSFAIGVPQDWSSRAIVYSAPLEDAPSKSSSRKLAGQWDMRYRDPRYLLSQAHRVQALGEGRLEGAASPANSASATRSTGGWLRDGRRGHTPAPPPSSQPEASGALLRDWSNVLGGGAQSRGGRGIAGMFPAKYNFDILAAPSCTGDFVVYPANAAGATSSGTEETYVSSFTGDPGQGSTRTVTVGTTAPRQVVLFSHATDNTGLNFLTAGVDNNTRAANLRDAINRWSHQTDMRAEAAGAQVTVYANTVGNAPDGAMSEALNNFAGNSAWPGVNGSGTAGQPTILAFNQIYQGPGVGACNGSWNQNGATKAPNTLWAYNTGSGYVVETSPVLSYRDNAKQVAFIQRSGNSLQLVLLHWAAGEGNARVPLVPATAASAAAYAAARSGSSSAMYVMTLNGTSNTGSTPAYSSPFVDYNADTLWVGDGNGRLHKFTGVFEGQPQEVVTGGFPATVEAGMKLSSPVYYAGNVYIGSQSAGAGIGGKVHRIDAESGAVSSSTKLANDNTTGIRESIIIDPVTNSVFAFLFNDGSVGDGSTCIVVAQNNNACRVVARFAAGFADGAQPLQRAYVGRGNSTVSTLYAGAFDEAYYTSADGTGAMYIVGGAFDDTFIPTLWKIPFSGGAMGAPLAGPVVGIKDCDSVGDCLTNNWDWSPVTTIKNGGSEHLYFSMAKKASAAGCTGDCMYMYNLTGATWGPGLAASAALRTYGGTGGIIVDNVSTEVGASQVYFAHGGNANGTGNAVQASQSALD